jgi:hypothetical protein
VKLPPQVEKLKRALLAEGGLPLVWLVLTAMLLIPVWHQRLLPMLDTPNHLALARAWHNFNDPTYRIMDYYTLRIKPVPYIFFYAFIHWFMYLFSIEVANKLFLSLYLILYPISVLALARAFKRSPWLAVGGFALAFSQPWTYGFSSYLLGTAFMLLGFAALIRYYAEKRNLDLIQILIWSLLAYLCHILPWFIFGLGAIGILLVHWRRWRPGLFAAFAMLPSLALALVAILDEQAEHAYINRGGKFSGMWRDFPTSVIEFPRRVMELFPGNLDTVVLLVLTATVLGLAIWKGTRSSEQTREEQRVLPLLVVLMGLSYVSLPYQVTKPLYWWYVAPRLPSMMAPLILLWPAVKLVGRQRLIMLPMVVACIALPIKLARLYRDFSNRNAPFIRLLGELPRGSSTMVVTRGMMRGQHSEEESGDPSTSAPVYWHFSSWPMALHGGYDPYLFDQGVPVRPRVTLRAPSWSTPDTFDIRQAPDFDYYLVRFAPAQMESEPSLKLIDQVGDWSLFQRTARLTDEP